MATEKILIVEDERIIALDLQRRLEKFGYLVTEIVSTGQQAIESTNLSRPDIIIMDIMLSGDMDGISAAGYIKENYEIPVIFLTAYSDEKTLERAKKVEPYGYILKPFKEKELYTTIDISIYKCRIEKELKIQKRWMSSILASIGDAIIATRKDGSINLVNTAAQKITGISETEATGKTWDEVLIFADPSVNISTMIKELSGKKHAVLENTVLIRNNTEMVYVNGVLTTIVNPDETIDGHVLVLTDISEVKRLSAQVTYQASHDILTGLINREAFSKALDDLFSSIQGDGIQHALIYLDLDQFRVVNEVAGHVAGDQLLRETTGIIKSVIRDSDICARLGADEFGIILRSMDYETVEFIAQRLHKRLGEHKINYENNSFSLKCSIGLVMINSTMPDTQFILAAADDACYLAKEEGGNRIKTYDSHGGHFKRRRGEMEWVSRLTSAIEEDRFVLYHQPIIPLNEHDSRMVKSEILIRMISEEGEMIMPADFIPSAERYNLMTYIDRWVISKSFSRIRSILDTYEDSSQVVFSINLCGASVADEITSLSIKEAMYTFNINPANICFEITESAAISNMSSASSFIREMKELGYTFSLDDFGSGFSSLNYLKHLPVDYLKIDGSFVRDMDKSHINSAMVDAINTLGHVIGIKTVAEFVGSDAIVAMLKKIGVDYAQGYIVGRPAPLDEFPVKIQV